MTERPERKSGHMEEWDDEGDVRSYGEVQATGVPADEWEYQAYSQHRTDIVTRAGEAWARLRRDIPALKEQETVINTDGLPPVTLKCAKWHRLMSVRLVGTSFPDVPPIVKFETVQAFAGAVFDSRPFLEGHQHGDFWDVERVTLHCEKCRDSNPSAEITLTQPKLLYRYMLGVLSGKKGPKWVNVELDGDAPLLSGGHPMVG